MAWGPLGWKAVSFSEIDKFPSAVLSRHYPDVPNEGDFTKADWSNYGPLDVIIAGTPCQDFSIAGEREGAEGERGNLTLEYARKLNESGISFKVFLWENVPGVLSDRGNAFGRFLAILAGEASPLVAPGGRWADAGYVLGPLRSIAWRCLDAQYFGLAQRRKRVFLVACPRNGLDPREVLFEFDGLRRDTPPGRSQKEDVAGTLKSRFGRNGGAANDDLNTGRAITQSLTCRLGSGGPDDNKAQGRFYVACGGHHFDELVDVAATIKTNTGASQDYESETFLVGPVAFHGAQDPDVSGDAATALRAPQGGGDKAHVLTHSAVRRLTPTECERLQGFPDGYTLIKDWSGWRNMDKSETPEKLKALGFEVHQTKKSGKWRVNDPDGPRYKALGNSMAVDVIRWLGERIERAILAEMNLQAKN